MDLTIRIAAAFGALLLLSRPVVAMEDCHGSVSSLGSALSIDGGDRESNHGAGRAAQNHTYALRLSSVIATYQNARYEGDYEGLALGLDARFLRLQLGVTLPAYRLVRNGAEEMGLGDVLLASSVTMAESGRGRFAFGANLGLSLPTGSATADLGMGHVMAMPGFWVSTHLGPVLTRLTLGYGIALVTQAGAHPHGDSPTPIVAPMNMSELEVSLASAVQLGRYFELVAGALGAAPVAMSEGIARASVYAGFGAESRGGFSARIEAHAPLVGDPFVAKGRLVITYAF